MKLILSPLTERQLKTFLDQPSQALLVVGPTGMGKDSILNMLAAKLLAIEPSELASYPYLKRLELVNNSLPIEQIRSLHDFVKLKTTGKRATRRLIIVPEAQAMTTEAQNAFLKLLEEPPSDTVILLHATDPKLLLPTVLSRVTILPVQKPPAEALKQFFLDSGYAATHVDRALSLSEGLPGLMAGLLHEDQAHPLSQNIEAAKALLAATPFERLQKVDELSKDKANLPALLDALKRICKVMLKKPQPAKELKAWQRRLKSIMAAQLLLKRNPQPKLLLTDLFMNL